MIFYIVIERNIINCFFDSIVVNILDSRALFAVIKWFLITPTGYDLNFFYFAIV
jgi:hypothetical protein